MAKQHTTVRFADTTLQRLDAMAEAYGDTRTAIIEQVIERYFLLVDGSRRQLPDKFSRDELCLIMDACNGLVTGRPSYIWAEVYDAIRLHRLDDKWSVDGQALVSKLQELSDVELYGLEEAIRRFWQQPDKDTDEALRLAFE